jgi:hypothetical protein
MRKQLRYFLAFSAAAFMLFVVFAYTLRQRPILLHILAETNCACGDYHQQVTGLIVRNPFRDPSPEQSATRFLEEVRDDKCTINAALCGYTRNGHRVSEWRLGIRRDLGQHVYLYYRLTKSDALEAKNRLSGEGEIELVLVQRKWVVLNYSSYF